MTCARVTLLALLAALAASLLLACTSASPDGTPASDAGTGGRPAMAASPGGKPATKISPDLLALHDAYREARQRGVDFRASSPLLRVVGDRVVIDATAAGDAQVLEADLVALGMRNASAFGRVVSGELPIDAIPALDSLVSLVFARPTAASRSLGSPQTPPRP